MARLTTAHFGQLEYEAESVFEFPGGVPGFDQHTQFLLLEQAHTKPLVFVQSLLSSDLCFIAVPIQIVDPQYRLELVEDDLASLQFPPASQPQIGQDGLQFECTEYVRRFYRLVQKTDTSTIQ